MIKVVLDTNVFISALFWQGSPYKLLQKGLNGDFAVFTSTEILDEVRDKLINKFNFPLDDADNFIEIITVNSSITEEKIKLNVVKKDSSDNKIIECAFISNVDYIVSGDKHLLDLKQYRKIRILSPQEFLKII